MKIFGVCLLVLVLSACSAKNIQEELAAGSGGISTTQFSDAQTVEEIRGLKPQAQLPLKIAVIPHGRWSGLSQAERAIIEAWGGTLQEMGFADTLQIIPRSLAPNCGYQAEAGCYLARAREAGARMGADAILFLDDSTLTDAYINPLSILNLTIVGMWLAPAHHRDAYSLYEASLFDINNGYLYAVAEGYGEHRSVRPFVYAKHSTGQEQARIKALTALGERLIELAQKKVNALSLADTP